MGGKKNFFLLKNIYAFFQKFTPDEKAVWKQKAVEFRKTPEYTKLKKQHKLRNPIPKPKKYKFESDSDEDDYWEINCTDVNKCT